MALTSAQFVASVMECLGKTQTELGVALRKPNAYATVHGWLDGKRLGYEDTMAMLEMCGWLTISAEEPVVQLNGLPEANRRRLEALEATVDEQGENSTRALEALEQQMSLALDRLQLLVDRATADEG